MDKIELPDGAWAMLRDPDEVTERQRRPLTRLQRRSSLKVAPHVRDMNFAALTPKDFLEQVAPLLSDEDFDVLEEIDDHVICTFVDSWSFELPVTPDGSLDLPPKARAALLEASKPLLGGLLGDTTDEDVLDPESPTAPANGSDKP